MPSTISKSDYLEIFGDGLFPTRRPLTVQRMTFLTYGSQSDRDTVISDLKRHGVTSLVPHWYEPSVVREHAKALASASFCEYLIELAEQAGSVVVVPVQHADFFSLAEAGVFKAVREATEIVILRRAKPVADAVATVSEQFPTIPDNELFRVLNNEVYVSGRQAADVQCFADAMSLSVMDLVMETRRTKPDNYRKKLESVIGATAFAGEYSEGSTTSEQESSQRKLTKWFKTEMKNRATYQADSL